MIILQKKICKNFILICEKNLRQFWLKKSAKIFGKTTKILQKNTKTISKIF